MNLRQRIRGLHPGQVGILALVGAMAVALLFQAGRHAAVEKRRDELLASNSQHDVDSLKSQINQTRVWMKMIQPNQRFNWRLVCMRERLDCPKLDTIDLGYAKEAAESRYGAAVADRNTAADRVVVIRLAIAAIVGLVVVVTWVWFGGRATGTLTASR